MRTSFVYLDNPPQNVLSLDHCQGLTREVEAGIFDPSTSNIVIWGKGRIFSSGADIREFDQPGVWEEGGHLPVLCELIESSPKPCIAIVEKYALGGGLELAMSCHFRIGVGKVKVGQPEIKIGLIPGAGGTQRLPRLVGVQKGVEMMLTGKMMGEEDGLETGLLDMLVDSLDEDSIDQVLSSLPLHSFRSKRTCLLSLKDPISSSISYLSSLSLLGRGRQAHRAIVASVGVGISPQHFETSYQLSNDSNYSFSTSNLTPFQQGLLEEECWFKKLLISSESKALRYLFFARNTAVKPPTRLRSSLDVNVGMVVGGGTMGRGIALSLVNCVGRKGGTVVVVERDEETARKTFGDIKSELDLGIKLGKLSREEAGF